MGKSSIDYIFHNKDTRDITVNIEPWAEKFSVPSGATLSIAISYGNRNGIGHFHNVAVERVQRRGRTGWRRSNTALASHPGPLLIRETTADPSATMRLRNCRMRPSFRYGKVRRASGRG